MMIIIEINKIKNEKKKKMLCEIKGNSLKILTEVTKL